MIENQNRVEPKDSLDLLNFEKNVET